jgi:quercetin dioxygenase-like cupin family protein
MKNILQYSVFFLIILMAGCNPEEKNGQSESVFPKGEKIDSDNFTGTVWLQMMGAKDSTLHAGYGNVTFEPGARTNWHVYPGGQLLFITKGKGYYKAKGYPVRSLSAGDVVEIPRNVPHWHGAAPDSEFAHIAVSINNTYP